MFKVKRISGWKFSDVQLRELGLAWVVVEEKLDGTEDDFGYFETKAKAELAASLLNECATVALA